MYWVQSTIVPLIANNGKPEQFIAIRADITVRKEMEVKMHNMAQHDALTGLPNRRQLMDRLSYEISSKKEQPNYSAFVLLDLDHFKEVNDTLGHVTGDELLRQVGERLDRSVRQTDTVARFGGDEFAVILEGVGVELDKAVANVKSACHIIRSTLLDSYLLDGQVIKIASSIGIVLFNSDEDTSIELMKQADIAMYKAKREGRNQICFFEPELQAEATESALLIRDLRQALANKELAVYYQPIVGVQQNIVGAEAVLRWFHPTRGKVSPERFIPLAEKSSLILSIGEWVLKKACLQLAEWSEDPLRKHLVIAVNISARQVSQVDFVERVKDMLVRTGARAERLKLELTESALQDNISSTINKMRALREVGVGFSLDDFGTGYSSLSYLKRLPIEQLKIDKSFINDIFDNNISSGIVRTIIRLEENLAIGVIAEGVESKEQLDWLIGYGCKFFQGYFFSRPVSVSLLNALLEKSP